jgi:hypothetical protein
MYAFWSAVARQSTGADPTLRCQTSRVGENGRIAEAGDVGCATFVDQYVRLKHEAMVN